MKDSEIYNIPPALKDLRIALVHDYLNQFGGAERVLNVLAEMFPESPIYTLFYDEHPTNTHLRDRIKKTSFLDRSFVRKHHRAFIPLMATAASSLNLGSDYDLIISDSAGFGKGVRYKDTHHISYCHSPLRYAWEPDFYLNTLFSSLLIKAGTPVVHYLRAWDKRAGGRPNTLITNSRHTASKLHQYYGREAEVIYPPVDDVFYFDNNIQKQGYFLAFGRIIHYKRFDLIVRAFNELRLPLKIVGTGPEFERVQALAESPFIEFIPFIENEDNLRRIIAGARAVIFPQVEDFGLTAAESLSCGTPVVAFGKGGGAEIVEDGMNGVLFDEQNASELAEAIRRFDGLVFNPLDVARSAEKFSRKRFEKDFYEAVLRSMSSS